MREKREKRDGRLLSGQARLRLRGGAFPKDFYEGRRWGKEKKKRMAWGGDCKKGIMAVSKKGAGTFLRLLSIGEIEEAKKRKRIDARGEEVEAAGNAIRRKPAIKNIPARQNDNKSLRGGGTSSTALRFFRSERRTYRNVLNRVGGGFEEDEVLHKGKTRRVFSETFQWNLIPRITENMETYSD